MSKEIYISSTPHETRLAIVENDELAEMYYERENEYTLAGSIYNGKVTRVLPGMQSSFVDVGLERDAFLYITDFMEEAGDSADFDADSGQRGRGREPRGGDAGRSAEPRDDQRGERQREGNRLAAPSDALPQEAGQGGDSVEQRQEPRSDRAIRSDRSDRGAGGRDRGRRRPDSRSGNRDDRAGNRDDRAGDRERRPASFLSAESSPLSAVPPTEFPTLALTGDAAEPPTDVASLGEGALGADGSRRWRGRRGRRRGRGPGAGDQPEVAAGPIGEEPAGNLRNEPGGFDPGYNLSSASDAFDTTEAEATGNFDLDASASAAFTAPQGEDASQTSPREPERGDRDSRDRRDRGDRGMGEGGRGGRQDRGRRAPRVPRGFAPSRALYGVEQTPTLEDAKDGDGIAPEPIVLPGESLSKYRTGARSESAANPAAGAPSPIVLKPSTEFTLPGTWDGGSVLPGESLSRRSRGDSARHPHPRSESRFQSRPEIRPAETHAEARTNARVPAAPEVIADQDGISVLPALTEQPLQQAAANLPEAAPYQTAPETTGTPATQQQANAEYEPVEASASLRYDPIPPSEYRQSAPAVEEAAPTAEESRQENAGKPSHSTGEEHGGGQRDVAGQTSLAPTSTPAEPSSAPVASEPFDPPAVMLASPVELFPDHDSGQPEHEFTSVTSAGEMLSEPALPPPSPEGAVPSDPIQHETAVHETSPHHTSEANFFAPGDGALEEEVLDDEEFDLPILHAGAVDEQGYEEETLEGAADLGTMIRDLSIDQITRLSEPSELEDDEILEEEDAAHDSLYVEAEEIEASGFGSSDSSVSDDDAIPADLTDTSEASFGAVAQDVEPSASDRERTDRSRRDGGRRGDRNDRNDRNDRRDRGRDRNSSGDHTSRPGRRDGRHSMQTTNLPAISDLLKPGQEVLVQIAKEPIAKKGARITSHIALPGRFLVFMPTVHHTGVSRKIESDGERRRLKEILLSERGEASGGFIVRTAAAGASEEELRSDLRFLLNLWADIKQRSESSKSPALIYHDLNLVERILRDQVTDSFSAIWVDTEDAYERVLRFLQRFQPSLIRRVKLYTKDTPLFEQFGITEEINKALRSKVWLKSGGSIVINQTEALVAIDINTGKYVGKTARLEDTIVKTNLDAIPEIVRQIRLRDLGGIIIIDFIDMDERKNRNRVMTALEDELKKDRAPSKVLQFNDFGLVAITRKRVKQSLERTLSATCTICQGTGMTKSPVTICNDIYVEMRKMQKNFDRGDVMLRVHPEVVKQLKSPGTRWLQEMEELVGKTILVKSDPALHPEQFDIH